MAGVSPLRSRPAPGRSVVAGALCHEPVVEPLLGQFGAGDRAPLAQDRLIGDELVPRVVGVAANFTAPAAERMEAALVLHLRAKWVVPLQGWLRARLAGRQAVE